MDFVTESLAVGDAYDVCRIGELQSQQIGAVLSLTRVAHPPLSMPHLLMEISDKRALAAADIEAAVSFVRDHVRAGRRVLVHCRSGISRSPALAACYLHRHEGCSIGEALARVKLARPQAEPHHALVEFDLRSLRT